MLENGVYNVACDMWSCGVVLYVLLSGGDLPYDAQQQQDVFGKILHNSYSLKGGEWAKRSAESIDLVKRLLTKNPKKRITAEEALSHTFLWPPT